jgi:hypothetical protein
MKAERCPSCEIRKASAAKNPDGLCNECNGGVYIKKKGGNKVERNQNNSR